MRRCARVRAQRHSWARRGIKRFQEGPRASPSRPRRPRLVLCFHMLLFSLAAVLAPQLRLAPIVALPQRHPLELVRATANDVVSPFQNDADDAGPVMGPLELTLENVEMVLDEMRPYLQADGGNVAVRGIENNVVQLELQVGRDPAHTHACGTRHTAGRAHVASVPSRRGTFSRGIRTQLYRARAARAPPAR